MEYRTLHDWNMDRDEAIAQQRALSDLVVISDKFGPIKRVAGVDLSFSQERNEGHAVVVVLSYPELEVVETQYATGPLLMPYIPGLLSFRESPIALEAFAKVQTIPDLIFVDGAGIAHPRRFGIASHLGILLDVPSIGVAKSRLIGSYDMQALTEAPGDCVPLIDHGETVGSVLRTKSRTNPLYISPGHRVSIDSACQFVQDCLRGYRLPEPTRQAHNKITEYRKQYDPVVEPEHHIVQEVLPL